MPILPPTDGCHGKAGRERCAARPVGRPLSGRPRSFAGARTDRASSTRAWEISPSFGAGFLTQISNGAVLDTFAEYVDQSAGFTVVPGAGIKAGQGKKLLAGVSVLF